jgi:hypothetical protein
MNTETRAVPLMHPRDFDFDKYVDQLRASVVIKRLGNEPRPPTENNKGLEA